MKVKDIKGKVAEKVGKAKEKIEKKCGKCKCALVLFAIGLAVAGCSTADAPTAQRAQNVTAEDITFNFNFAAAPAVTNGVVAIPNFHFEIATAAQANETSGTETMTATNTQTPTNDIKTDAKFTYGLQSDSAAGTSWLGTLTDASLKGLSTWLKSGKANGEMTITKTDGSTEKVTCKDGTCTTSSGDCITCSDCTACKDCSL